MIRTFILGLVLLSAFACQDKESLGSGGTNPLNEVTVSQKARPGEEVVVQWNGFGKEPVLCLRDSEGNDSQVEVGVVTSSGLIFKVPYNIADGEYGLLYQNQGRWQELGRIEILVPDLPVTGLKFPSVVEPGKEFILEGVGLTDDYELVVEKDGSQFVLESVVGQSSFDVSVPENFSGGVYSLYLSDGNFKWLISEHFRISERKKLLSVSMTTHAYATISTRVKYEVEYDNDAQVIAIVFTSVQMDEGEVVSEDASDRYVLDSEGVFKAEGGESSSNNIDFGYSYDTQGRLASAQVRRFSRTNPEGNMVEFLYVYNQDDSPSQLTYVHDGVTRSMQLWLYEDGNIVEMKAPTIFAYEDASLTNNPFAQDFAMAYAALSDVMEPFVYAPYLIGKHPFVSRLLPSSLYIDPGNGKKEKVDLTYTYDADGYMVKAEMKSVLSAIEFEYTTL